LARGSEATLMTPAFPFNCSPLGRRPGQR
jgi:hypothetical protein